MENHDYTILRLLAHVSTVIIAILLRFTKKVSLPLPASDISQRDYNILQFMRWTAFTAVAWTILDYVLLQSVLHWYVSGAYADYVIYWIMFFLLDTVFIAFRFPGQQRKVILLPAALRAFTFPFTRLSLVWLALIYRVCRYAYVGTLLLRLLSVVLIPVNYPAEDAHRKPDMIVFRRFHVNLVVHENESINEKQLPFYYCGKPNTADLVVYNERSSLFKEKILTIKNVSFFHLEEPYEPGSSAYTPGGMDLLRFSGRVPLSPDTATFWHTKDDVLLVARSKKEGDYFLVFAHRYEQAAAVDTICINLHYLKNKIIHYGS